MTNNSDGFKGDKRVMHKKISIRRLLTFALAGIIALESPITAYAANQDETAWMAYDQEENSPTSTMDNETIFLPDEISEDEIDENDENIQTEDSQNNEDDQIEGDQTEDIVNNEGGQTEDIQNNEDNQPEDIVNDEGNQSEDSYGSTSEEDLEAEELDSLQSFDEIIEIDYNTALNEGVTVTAPYGEKNKAYYSMTIPEDGQYAFYTDEKVGSGRTYMAMRADIYKANADRYEYVSSSRCLAMPTGYMKKGETIYFELYNLNVEETYNMRVANQTKLTKTAENSYSYILPEGNSIEINAVAGYKYIKYGAAMKADSEKESGLSGNYVLDYYFDYEDKWDKENGYFTLSLSNKYSDNKVKSSDMECTYNNYYVLTNSSGIPTALPLKWLTAKPIWIKQ